MAVKKLPFISDVVTKTVPSVGDYARQGIQSVRA